MNPESGIQATLKGAIHLGKYLIYDLLESWFSPEYIFAAVFMTMLMRRSLRRG